MKRAISTAALVTQSLWERFEGPIIVVLGVVYLVICAHFGLEHVR